MKKYISYLLTLALIVPTLVSCTEQLEEIRAKKNTHTVYFSTSGQTTKTGLTIDGNMVNPDWRQTDVENVHFFEMETAGGDAAYAVATKINPSSDNITAHFEASFGETMDIIVNPAEQPTLQAGKSASGTNFYYGAVVAQRKDTGNEEEYIFEIPANQNPNDETLKDPAADFLVGFSRKACAAPEEEENVVDLYFDRVAALGRFAFTNFKETDEKVMSVKIESEAGLVGYASYSNIIWGDENAVSFTRVAGPLTLSYGENGVAVPTGENAEPFYAYFVVIPGEATITSIEVVTDQYKYTKTPAEPVPFTFSAKEFMPIAMDLSTATAEEISSNVWYKASVLEDGYDYIIVSADQALTAIENEGVVSSTPGVTNIADFLSDDKNCIDFNSTPAAGIIWKSTAHVEYFDKDKTKPAGHFTLSQGEGENLVYLERHSDGTTQNGSIVSTPTADDNKNYKYYVWDCDGEHLYQISRDATNGTYYLYYSSGWKFEYESKPNTYLYTNRPPQGSISFESSTYSKVLEEGAFTIVAQGEPSGAVTYSSSDTEVATVDANTGEVTPVKTGTVVITATAAGSDTYQAAVASYTLTITSTNIPTWYKVDEIVADEKYLVISNDYALDNNGTNGSAVLLEGVGETVQYDAPNTMIWTATNESSGKFRLTGSDNKVIRLSSSAFQIGTPSGTESNNQWSLNANGKLVSGNYYLYYSTGNEKWSVSRTASEAHSGYLYSSTPPLAPRNLKFTPDGVTCDYVDGVGTMPVLDGVTDNVKYSSSNTSVATVNENTGEVSLTGTRGSVRIIASAPKSNTHKAETVSYNIIVKNSNDPSSTKTYYKVGAIANLEVGAQYLLVFDDPARDPNGDGNCKVFLPTLTSDGKNFQKKSDCARDVVVSNGMISGDYDNNQLSLETGYYLKANGVDKYIYPVGSTSGSGSLGAEDQGSHKLTISFDEGIAQIKNDIGYLVWSTSSHYFSANVDVSGSYSTGICLYILDDSSVTPPTPEEQDQDLSFPQDSYTAQMGTAFSTPTLSGAKTTVTYSSSATGVATVNASTGAVTLVGPGETTITASAPAGTVDGISYKAGSAQYTLTVNPASSDNVSYVKVSGLISGQTYLIVSHGDDLAFKGDGTTNGASMKVSPENGVITGVKSDFKEYEAVIKEESAGHFSIFFTNLAKYLAYLSSNSGLSTSSSWTSGSGSDFSLSMVPSGTNAGSFVFTNSSKYLYHNGTQFKIGGSGSEIGVHLYMLYNGEELAQNLSFSPTSVTIRQNQSFTEPTLLGAKTAISYSSDNQAVAEVNSTTGKVTVKGVGTALITASAAKATVNGINYGSATATYTLTVNEAAAVQYYKKISSRDDLPSASQTSATGDYLFVYEDGDKAYVFKAICDGTPTGAGNQSTGHIELTKSGSAIEVDLTADGIAATDVVKDCKIQLAHHSTASRNDWNIKPSRLGTYWVRVNNDSTSGVRILAMTSAGYSGTFTFSDTGNNLEIKRTDSNRDAYWSYNSTNNCFEATATASKISIYKLSE